MKNLIIIIILSILITACKNKRDYKVGDIIDSLNSVSVFYNKKTSNVSGRNKTPDGYNLGLKYQCVEFVKRYYYKKLNHKMPNSYGHAKDFYNKNIKDGKENRERGLIQFSNLSKTKPKIEDIIIFKGHIFNKFGHIAIISKVSNNEIEIIQQNTGKKTRRQIKLINQNGLWEIGDNSVLGRLRKK